jgi:hypothetical protein
MDKHVTSLEISKELAKNGFKKETEFWWRNFDYIEHAGLIKNEHFTVGYGKTIDLDDNQINMGYKVYPAPFSDEILEEVSTLDIITYIAENKMTDVGIINLFRNVNYLAKMWLYLKKENLL